jgi:RimJ/RimL family protein N-acetyltransferase
MPSATKSSPLRLRAICSDDAAAITALLAGDTELALQTATIPIPYTMEDARNFLRSADPHRIFAITAGDELVGMIGMIGADGMFGAGEAPKPPAKQKRPKGEKDQPLEVGYWIGRIYWGRGYASAALGLVIEEAVRRQIPRLIAHVFPDNAASIRVLENNGFALLSEVRRNLPQRGGNRRLLQFQREL